jgi:hypothetical protein
VYAGGGKNTVESCRSIDVLRWNKLGYLRSPLRFSWAWSRNGEQVASINVQTQRHSVMLKYRSRLHSEDWSDVTNLEHQNIVLDCEQRGSFNADPYK